MKWIGITGGIASGKSTVAELIKNQGYPVVDADQMARRVVAPGTPGWDSVVQLLGKEILDSKGEIQRIKVGEIIFSNAELKKQLEKIIHPLVQARVRSAREEHAAAGATMAFYDVPLLFENHLESQFAAIIVVACAPETQIQRLMQRSHLTKEQAQLRMSAQWPLEEKISKAHYVIQNEGRRDELEAQVRHVLSEIRTKLY